jgi:hypothetical protein
MIPFWGKRLALIKRFDAVHRAPRESGDRQHILGADLQRDHIDPLREYLELFRSAATGLTR